MNYSLEFFQHRLHLLRNFNIGLISSSNTKANHCFVSLDSTKNAPRLHIDMNFGLSFLVDFGGGGIGFMAIIIPSHVNM